MEFDSFLIYAPAGLVLILTLYVLYLKGTARLRVERAVAEREKEFEERVKRERQDAVAGAGRF